MLILASLTGCRSLDDDTAYTPSTKMALFLAENPTDSTQKTIVAFTDSTFLPDWQTQFGIEGSNLTTFAGDENTLWISEVSSGEIHQIDLRETQKVKTYVTQGVRPDLMVQGNDYLLFADRPARRLGFLDLSSEEIFFVETDSSAQSLYYNSGKFYVVGTYEIVVFSETALAPLASETTDTPINHSQFNREGDLVLIACEGTDCKQYSIDANANLFTANSPVNLNYQGLALSPFLRQQYGNEYLEDFRLRDGVLEPLALDSLNWYSIDFFEGDVYYNRESESGVSRLGLHTPDTITWIGNTYKSIEKTYFYIDSDAN